MQKHDDIDGSSIPREMLRELVGEFDVVSTDTALATPHFEKPAILYRLWRSWPGKTPHYANIKPGAVDPEMMPYTVIMDVLDSGKDYRFRFYGTVHVAHFGGDLTGMTISEVEKANPASKVIRELYDKVLEKNNAVFFHLNYLSRQHVVKRATGVMMPLSDDSGNTVRLVGNMYWFKG